MRNSFAREITTLASKDKRIVLLSGDIGNRLFDPFKEQFQDRFYNCGVAEANMASMAAGMALCGLRPITYTITAFNTVRCLEQIRVDICYQNLPVIIIGVGSGLSYAALNATHHTLEDIAFMRVLPNMTVLCPGDPFEVSAAIRASLKINGPVYIRMAKKNEPQVHSGLPDFTIGKGIIVKPGKDICFLNAGSLLPAAMEAADVLAKKGISVQVVSMHTVKPLDEELLTEVFSKFSTVFTIEEHGVLGGFGGAVSEWMSEQRFSGARLYRIGTPDEFMYKAGETDYAYRYFGLDSNSIVEKVLKLKKPDCGNN